MQQVGDGRSETLTMHTGKRLAAGALACCISTSSYAVEGSTAAGPIGGTDIRSAQLPPPGLYGGSIFLYAEADRFFDRNGKPVPALAGLRLERTRAAPFLLYVPNLSVLGGSIGIGGMVPIGTECGTLTAAVPERCIAGVGDPYVEVTWSRFFGTMRASKFPGAFPIAEGLTTSLGFGAVIPVGRYSAKDATTRGLAVGNNTWDFAPIAGFTYVTKPILADGTEISARLFWNNYLENPATQYATGSLVNIDFALTERIGRIQVGLAGNYAFQTEDDKLAGVAIAPDGRRLDVMFLGGVMAFDMPELSASLKFKLTTTVLTHNTVNSTGAGLMWVMKF
jgi:hypothetical protein